MIPRLSSPRHSRHSRHPRLTQSRNAGNVSTPSPPSSSPGATCPTCRLPYDTGRKRRLRDSCGHERCYSCVFLQEDCPVCRPAASRPPSVMDLSCQYGAPTSAMPTPVIRRPRAAASPAPGRPGSFVQRYHRRPVTVSIDDTLSGKASSFLPPMSGHGRAKTSRVQRWLEPTGHQGLGGEGREVIKNLVLQISHASPALLCTFSLACTPARMVAA